MTEKTTTPDKPTDANGVESSVLLADCACMDWASDRREIDNEHHHRCEHWKPSRTPNLRHATFGRLMWEYLLTKLPEFTGDEWAEDIMPLAEKAGLCVWTRYDRDTHGDVGDSEEGDMIWYWGSSDSSANS